MPKLTVGSLPPEANQKGSINETVTEKERNAPTPEKLDEGPKRNAAGGYEPAAYRTASGSVRVDR